jgi:serine/threonine protein kinase
VDALPRKLGRYLLEELLATGGMAEIYRARLQQPVESASKELVIKRVLPHLARNREFIELFLDEARISVPLSHGNIAQVFELGQEGEDYFLVMEYVRGRDLEAVLQRLRARGERMPIPLAVFVASEAARGLDYAHAFRDADDRPAGIVHRDMSPHNVLVGLQGEVKIVDFGIAKAQSRLHQTTRGIIRGKACYLSPEQAECRPLDGRSDQFSLGVVLWEMLTGQRALEGETEVATLERVRAAQVAPPSALRPEVPPELDRVVQRALARDPVGRFSSCGDLQAALARVAATGHTPAPGLPQAASPAALGAFVRSLFSEEITREIAARGARAQLLAKLSPAERDRAATLTTDEILRMGTLSIQAPPPASPPAGRRRGWWPALGLAALILLGGAAGAWFAWGGPTDAGLDAGPEPSGQADGASSAVEEPAEEPALPDAGPAEGDAEEAAPEARPPPAEPPPPPPVEFGLLNLNASPWAYVELDGRRLPGETPLFRVRVSAGTHRLRFFNPELKIERVETVTVRAGQTHTLSVELPAP